MTDIRSEIQKRVTTLYMQNKDGTAFVDGARGDLAYAKRLSQAVLDLSWLLREVNRLDATLQSVYADLTTVKSDVSDRLSLAQAKVYRARAGHHRENTRDWREENVPEEFKTDG